MQCCLSIPPPYLPRVGLSSSGPRVEGWILDDKISLIQRVLLDYGMECRISFPWDFAHLPKKDGLFREEQ